jgi:hypothetical protein
MPDLIVWYGQDREAFNTQPHRVRRFSPRLLPPDKPTSIHKLGEFIRECEIRGRQQEHDDPFQADAPPGRVGYGCEVGNKKCVTWEKFDNLVRPYMSV